MDIPHKEEDDDELGEVVPTQTVVVVDPSALEDQLIFSEEQLAESLAGGSHHIIETHDGEEIDASQLHHHHVLAQVVDEHGGSPRLVVIPRDQMQELQGTDGMGNLTRVVQMVPVTSAGLHVVNTDGHLTGVTVHQLGLHHHHHVHHHHEEEEEEGDASLMDTTEDDEGQMLETITEEGEEVHISGDIGDIPEGALIGVGDGLDENEQHEQKIHHFEVVEIEEMPPPPPPPPEEVVEEEQEEEEIEPPCQCPTCLENADEEGHFKGLDPAKIKCVVCYITMHAPEHLIKRPQTPSQPPATSEGASEECNLPLQSQDTQRIVTGEEIEQMETQLMETPTAQIELDTKSKETDQSDVTVEADPSPSKSVKSDVGEHDDATAPETMDQSFMSEKESQDHDYSEEDPRLNLDLLFQILNCSADDLDQDVDALLNYIPLCEPCHALVTDTAVIFREIQKLQTTLGTLRESVKEHVSRSFEANFCKRKKETEEILGVAGQVDALRRAILGEDCPAIARLLNYKKKGRRGRRPVGRRKTVINRAALYPHVTIDTNKAKKGKAVKRELLSDGEFAEEEEEEEHEVIQTHSGRRVKKPNYKKWFLIDDDEDDSPKAKTVASSVVKRESVEEGGADDGDNPPSSPKSEGDWSPGHSDEDFQEEEESESSSEDSDLGNSDEENDLDADDEDYTDSSPSKKRRRPSSNANRLPCVECTRTFTDEDKRERHYQRYHVPGGRGKRRRKGRGGSFRSHTCEHCEKEFKRPNLLKRHLEKDHGIFPDDGESADKKKHVCEFCGQKYRNGSELRVHVRLHTGETPFKCDHCDQSFVSALKRETHIEQCHYQVPPLKCEFCDRAFFRQHRLRIHRITHTGERAYLCEICSQAFSHPTYLKYHQGQHAELNMESYKCKECGKQFANPTNLKLHVKTVHLKEFRFSCEVCGMGFTHMSHKRIHMRGHTGERPYKCEICGESFRYKDRLRIHLRGHTGERPFVCDVCKKGFASRSKLKRHEKIHEKSMGARSEQESAEPQRAMRYSCEDCGKAFAEPQHLSAHKRYCQRKVFTVKEEKPKIVKSTGPKIKAVSTSAPITVTVTAPPQAVVVPGGTATVQKIQIEHIPVSAIQTQQGMLVPVTYTYPVTYGYEVTTQEFEQPTTSVNVRQYPYN